MSLIVSPDSPQKKTETLEEGAKADIFSSPLHPYTQALLSCVPIPDPDVEKNRERILLTGDIPSPVNAPPGCHFHPRCRIKEDRCTRRYPEMREILPGHRVACHLA